MSRHILFNSKENLLSYTKIGGLTGVSSGHFATLSDKVAFITGGTGFIGGYLLLEMLKSDDFKTVYCLVRKSERESVQARLLQSLQSKGYTQPELPNSIVVLEGDIMSHNFGLDQKTYDLIQQSATDVFHLAAVMNWVAPFNQSTIGNINALKQCISLCGSSILKKLHYASSMGIWTLLNQPAEAIAEDALPAFPEELPGGYFQSKWINELLCQRAMESGIPVNIFRLGDVKGNSVTGHGDPNNLGNVIMKYFIKEGIILDQNVVFNYLPVEYLAQSIYYIALNSENLTYQFSNEEYISFHDMYTILNNEGFKVRLIGMDEWLKKLRSDECDLSLKLRPVFKPFKPYRDTGHTTLYDMGTAMFRNKHLTDNTQKTLADSNVKCPKMLSDGVLSRYLLHLENSIELVG